MTIQLGHDDSKHISQEELEKLPMYRRRYTVEDFNSVVKGEVDIPNSEPIEHELFIRNIAAIGHRLTPIWGLSLRDGLSTKEWTQFFLAVDEGWGYAAAYPANTLKFALCKHEKALGPHDHPNHIRGWHPGVCRLCGLNMSVDSGD